MKAIVLSSLLLFGVCGGLGADCSEVAQAQAQSQVDCSMLSPEEEQFAMGLMPGNQKIFCQQFNQDQRASAMQMVGEQDQMGNTMNGDQAVRKVAMDNNITPMMQQKQPSKKSNGCPARSGTQ